MTRRARLRLRAKTPDPPTLLPVDVKCRPAEVPDRVVARRIHHRAFREVVERQFGTWDESQQDDFFDGEWQRHPHEIVLLNGDAVGYVAVEHLPDHVFVHNVVLDPSVQGQGIGTSLLSKVVGDARKQRHPVRLQVLQANPAVSLYRRLGFAEVGRTSTHLLMERAT
jgi:ribosomal protein S18 acetylase RimI-like enzyme